MGMDIPNAIVQTAKLSASGQSAPTRRAQEGAGAFRQELVQKVGSSAPGGTPAAAPPVQQLAASPAGLSAEGQTEDIDGLLAAIDELLAKLQEPEDETDELADSSDPEDLKAGLDQLNALLALIGGAPIVPNDAWNDSAEQAADSLEQAGQLKVRLQDALLHLQEIAQQGPLKQIRHRNAADLIDDQLKSLAALLEGAGQASKEKEASAVNLAIRLQTAGSSSDSVSDVSVTIDHTPSLLHRLTNETRNLSILSAAAEQSANGQGAETQAAEQPTDSNALAGAAAAQAGTIRSEASGSSGIAAAPVQINADRFAESMTSYIVRKFDVSPVDGGMEARIQLRPEHLGHLDLSITVQNGQLTAVFHTDSAMAKEMLDNQMAQLRLALQSQGLSVDKLEVWQGQPAAQFSDGQAGRGGNRQQTPGRGMLGEPLEGIDADFEEEMAEQAAIQHLGYGRSINETA